MDEGLIRLAKRGRDCNRWEGEAARNKQDYRITTSSLLAE